MLHRSGTKKAVVMRLLRHRRGVSVGTIAQKLGVSPTAAQSLLNDVKRVDGVSIVRERDPKKGISLYKIAS